MDCDETYLVIMKGFPSSVQIADTLLPRHWGSCFAGGVG